MAKENRTLWETIKDALTHIVNSLKELMEKDIIRKVAPQLATMEPVAKIEREAFDQKHKSDIAKDVSDEFKRFGNKVDREHFGVVLLEYNQINKALNYLDTDAEKVALLAVPRVIKRGIKADYHEEHKGRRNVDSIAFAAPIEINGKRGNMGVVVQRVQGTNRYKTHRIIIPDGSVFIFESKKQRRKPVASLLYQKGAHPSALFLLIFYHKLSRISILPSKKINPALMTLISTCLRMTA